MKQVKAYKSPEYTFRIFCLDLKHPIKYVRFRFKKSIRFKNNLKYKE